MERKKVKSSNVASVGYDVEQQILEVEFKGGGLYQYFKVPEAKFKALLEAESVGKFLGSEIKPAFAFKKVDPIRPA